MERTFRARSQQVKRIKAIALWRFEARNKEELSFDVGEMVTVTLHGEDGWWHGCTTHAALTTRALARY